MSDGNATAYGLLQRILAGERGPIVLHLAMLLEQSSSLTHEDEHYRTFLPSDLIGMKLNPETVADITHILCEEISKQPDADLLTTAAMTGATEVTRLAVELLTDRSRSLGIAEYGQALGILGSYLPNALRKNPTFLSDDAKRVLIAKLTELKTSNDVSTRHNAEQLVAQLSSIGGGNP